MSIGIKAKWVIAFDGESHRLVRDGVVVVEGDRVAYVGRRYQGKVDQWIQAPTHVVTPGFISTHVHAATSPKDKTFIDDVGARHFWMSSLGENLTALGKSISPSDYHVFAKYSMAELLRSGCTTMVEIGMVGALGEETAVKYVDELGIRAVLGHTVEDGRWARSQRANLYTEWLGLEEGLKQLERAEAFVERFTGAAGGRVMGALYPSTVDKVSLELQAAVRESADRLGCPVSIHAAQWVVEFQNMIRMYAKTPIQVLAESGLLGPGLIIGHGWAIAGHPLLGYPDDGHSDLELIAQAGATVSHDPLVFAKRGNKMHSHSRYLKAGVNVSIGCDTSPQDMLNEMRMASYTSKLADWSCFSGSSAEIHSSATLGGARGLRRRDLGRLCPGAKADLAVVNMETLNNVPCRDPVRALVNSATREDVTHVMVDGRLVVEEGRLLTVDEAGLVAEVQRVTEAIWDRIPENHYLGLPTDQVSPPSYEPWEPEE